MHHHHRQQQLSLIGAIIFKALLLNVHHALLSKADDWATSCYRAESDPTCPLFKPAKIFPFTSQTCGLESSFVLSGCDTAADGSSNTTWPNFARATNNVNYRRVPTVVMNLSTTTPNDLGMSNDTNISGSISLTWSPSLTSRTTCLSPASLSQISGSHYLPPSIDLTSFAHSSFQLTPSNIILLFNCTSSFSVPGNFRLQENSTACRSFAGECGLQTNCYEYIVLNSKKLKLRKAIKKSGCGKAMFFVVSQLSLPASRWSPGLIQLNWSTVHNPWMASNLESCELCSRSNGVCGYNISADFQCYCGGNRVSATNCAAFQSSSGWCRGIKCKVGMGAAGFLIALSLLLTLFCIWKRKGFVKTSFPFSSAQTNKVWKKKAMPSFLSRKDDPILAKVMSYQEILHATESFAEKHIVGYGGFGAVYKGVLSDGRHVAVKKLFHDNHRRTEHFLNEIKVLSNLNHPNLVKLYGFCYEDERELILVFEYAPQGTISDHLHDVAKPAMSWKLRLNVACETAEALSYLHNSVSPPIYHRDVKTDNILLDEGFHAKLADFGLSKLVPLKATHVSTAPQGTPGYLDPEYYQCYRLTDKSDVYSLGVVLMELITAKLAVDISRGPGDINLSALAVTKIECGQWEELVDPTLKMKKNPCVKRSIKRVVELASQCLHTKKEERPTMSVVAGMLTKIQRELEDDNAEALVNLQISTPTDCVSKKPLQQSQSSPCSVLFFSGSSSGMSNS